MNGAWHAFLIAFIALKNYLIVLFVSVYSYDNFDNQGRIWSLGVIGMFAFTSIVIVTNIKILTFTNTSYPFSLIILYGSILFYLLTYIIASNMEMFDCYNTFERSVKLID